MGGRDLTTEIQAILERLMAPISESDRPGIRAQIYALQVPAVISEEDMYFFLDLIYTYFHTQGFPETHEQKRARQVNTQEFYKMLGVKLLRGRPKSYSEILKQIYNQKLEEQTLGQINASMMERFRAEEEASAKAFSNAMLKGGSKKKKRTHRKSRKLRR